MNHLQKAYDEMYLVDGLTHVQKQELIKIMSKLARSEWSEGHGTGLKQGRNFAGEYKKIYRGEGTSS